MVDWEEILRDDGPAVWRTARRILGNDADADECFQEAFLGALEVSRQTPVRHWAALLTRLATARAIDRLRMRVRRRRREDTGADPDRVPQSGALPSDHLENAELSQQLRDALAKLSGKQAEIFCLAGLNEWSHRRIAEQMGMSVDSVGVTIHRARQKLNSLLRVTIEEASG